MFICLRRLLFSTMKKHDIQRLIKKLKNAVAATGMELLEGRLPGFIVFFIFAFCFKLIRSYTFV